MISYRKNSYCLYRPKTDEGIVKRHVIAVQVRLINGNFSHTKKSMPSWAAVRGYRRSTGRRCDSHTGCTSVLAHPWALQPLPRAPLVGDQIPVRNPQPALVLQGTPPSPHSPTGRAGGGHPDRADCPPSCPGGLVLPTPQHAAEAA